MGRPSKGDREQLKTRAPKNIAEQIKSAARAAGQTVSDYLIACALAAATCSPAVAIAVVESAHREEVAIVQEAVEPLPEIPIEVLQEEVTVAYHYDDEIPASATVKAPIDYEALPKIPVKAPSRPKEPLTESGEEQWIVDARKRHEARLKEQPAPGSLAAELAAVRAECEALGLSTAIPESMPPTLPKRTDAVGYLRWLIGQRRAEIRREEIAALEAERGEARAAPEYTLHNRGQIKRSPDGVDPRYRSQSGAPSYWSSRRGRGQS